MKITRLLFTVSMALFAGQASAGTILIPSTTVLSTDVSTGPSIVLPVALDLADTLSIEAQGQVFLQNAGTSYGVNPAGVVTTAGSRPVGTTLLNGAFNFGALLFGNST